MSRGISNEVKKLWDTWNLRVLILISLSLQAFLILFATFRKRSASKWVVSLIWSAYLLADWVAAVCIGLISRSQGDGSSNFGQNGDVLAFWAPFLLLHLGGPDTITSFSLEDNELWLRHLLGLLLQVGAAIYVFLQTLTKNKLWVPTMLILVAGTIRYAERTRALFLSSLDHFGDSLCRKPNPGPEYESVLQMYNAIRFAHLPARVQMVEGPDEGIKRTQYKNSIELAPLDPMSLLHFAFGFFETFKGLIAGLRLSSEDRLGSRDFFLNRTGEDAFKLVEVELSLMYEVLHTKVMVLRSWEGYIFRVISSGSVVVAIVVFCFIDKQGFHKFEVRVTYALLIGALVLDAVSVFKVMFFDRTFVTLKNRWSRKMASFIIKRRRWSEIAYGCNFMSYCLKGFPQWIHRLFEFFWAGTLLDKIKLSQLCYPNHVDAQLKHFIFTETRKNSLYADDTGKIGEICSSRGARTLSGLDRLMWSVSEFEYTESLLLWHIATELCYNHRSSDNSDINRGLSKLLSDYAFYLVMMEPAMMASVSGNWQLAFQDTFAEAKSFFKKYSISEHGKACDKILSIKADIKPGAVKGDLSKSVFFDACILTNQLLVLENKWEIFSKVWLEFLCYAAVHCRANVHAQQPSKGGQLLTVIWLLMNHFGLGNQFYEANVARIKFIVRK